MRFCLEPGCQARVERGRCADHARRRDVQQRGSARARGYTSQWDAASQAFLSVYRFCGMRPGGREPVMSRCHRDGIVTVAEVTDHVEPHRGDSVKFWDCQGNWQALCRECHDAKTRAGL